MGTLEKIARAILTSLSESEGDETRPKPSINIEDGWEDAPSEKKSAAIDLIERYASNLHYAISHLGTTVDEVEGAKAKIDIARLRLAARALRKLTPDYAPSEIIARNHATEELRARKASGGHLPMPETTPHPTMGAGMKILTPTGDGIFGIAAAPSPPDEPGFFGLATAQDSFADPPQGCPEPPAPDEGWGEARIAHMPCRSKASQRIDNELFQCPACHMLSRDGSTWWAYIPISEETTNESDD